MDSTEKIDKDFLLMASFPDDRVDLAHGALIIAQTAYPDLEESIYLERLDRLAAKLKNGMAAECDAIDIITKINQLLFDDEKLRGNRRNYYDPDNSFLNRVLDRKLGIPITLSLIYIEVAGRLGLDVRGIGLPGHFITALYHASGRIFIDPFNRGEIRTVEECREIIRTHLDETNASDPHWLKPIGKKEFLARMLRNLKFIYAKEENDTMLFRMIHWILALQPEAPPELRERALLYEAMGNPDQAIKDWERYIESISDPGSEKSIRERIDYLKKQKPRIH
ncbi:MAG: transglutaminase-like domain-containing protein [Desulfobacterales bacterium]|jgi:regulator of sirC expression with transglutaminase-like and TPR domain